MMRNLFPWLAVLAALLGLTGCFPEKEINIDTGDTGVLLDSDGDGYDDWEDCDPHHAQIHPGAVELCDEIDNDCDGEIDEEVTTTFYVDADGDLWGDPTNPVEACGQPDGTAAVANDCDDTNADISPSGTEVCDGVDNDCDGFVDDDDIDSQTELQEWFLDADSDGYGDSAEIEESCAQPSGYVSNDNDCDDSDAGVNPAAMEICDDLNIDEDCDGTVDDDDATVDAGTMIDWWQDADGDGYGDPSGSTTTACDQPTGYAENTTDCDDTNADVNPGEREICGDDVDNNCDISDDEDPNDWYVDDDEDGYGDSSGSALTQCGDPSDSGGCSDADTSTTCYAPDDNTDCDDTDGTINPAATEYCDSVDNDCDGSVDESDAVDASTWYVDNDGDTYGDPSSSTVSCTEPSGYVSNDSDCDDTDSTINPDASEVCDAADIDEDCNGSADDADSGTQSSSMSTWYLDSDADGYGELSSTMQACDEPSGYVTDNSDCNDSDSAINPGATEVCDSSDTDEDCDGAADDDDTAVDTSTLNAFYVDADGDGYGNTSSVDYACDQPSGYVTDNTDCDDTDVNVNPGETEVCDEDDTDEDCNGDIDDDDAAVDSSTLNTWYADSDGDGYGDASSTGYACDQPSGYVTDNTDCDDADSSVISGEWYPDEDEDGYGDDSATVTSTCTDPSDSGGCTDGDTSTACYVAADNSDCDDSDDEVNPEGYELFWDWTTATEYGSCTDGIDNDCNGYADSSDTEPCSDVDGDGEYDGAQQIFACDPISYGYDYALCVVGGFSGSWLGEDSYYTHEPFTSINLSYGNTPITAEWGGHTYTDVNWISGGAAAVTGTYIRTMVSDLANDGSSTVDSTDTSTWEYLDLGDYCGSYSVSTYCESSPFSPYDVVIYDWDGGTGGTDPYRLVSAP